jgi:long-chain acyl-CoA synthetase
VAVVVPEDGATVAAEELRDHVRRALRGSRTPDRVVFRDELPVTPTGKILRRQLLDDICSATTGR